MKIEKLRKNHKKEIIIGTILTVVIGGALTYKLTHSKYRTTQSINLATGVINYTVPDFKIMAMYKNDGSGDVSIDSMPTSGYVINEEKTYCQTSSGSQVKGKIKTVNGIHGISGLNKGDKCYLYFDKIKITNVDSLIANLTINNYSPTFSNVATTDEGVFQTSDGMYGGTTYYWRGKVENNYVKLAGFCWRIIRINGDKTIRMIYDGTTCHANGTKTTENLAQPTSGTTGYAYNPTYNASYYVGWTYSSSQRPSSTNNNGSVGTASNAKTQLQTWYNANLKSYEGKIADGKYCNDRDVGQPLSNDSGYVTTWSATGTAFNYAGRKRLYTDYSPTFNCNNAGDVYTLKVGLITADEVEFAGGKNEGNSSYYLYNGQTYWTMSPYYWYGGYADVFVVGSYGTLGNAGVHDANGLRPVINLKADTTFASGDGTILKPYVVS